MLVIETESIQSCANFASKSESFFFDRYDMNSLNTRAGRNNGFVPVHYKVTDTNRICHFEIKHFLASVKTKKELTDLSPLN